MLQYTLQTFLQLNILILATPALAGWSLLPPAHPGLAHAAGIVWQYRTTEPNAAKTVALTQVRRASGRPSVMPSPAPVLVRPAVFAAVPAAALRTCIPFPHAARAP